MKESIIVKLIKNKKNGQFNISIPKKKISKKLLDELDTIQRLKINLEEWK